MDAKPGAAPEPPGAADPQGGPAPAAPRTVWRGIRDRIIGGLVVVLPIVITVWVLYWLYSFLQAYVIDPLAQLLLWLVRGGRPGGELPYWFETYAAPVIAVAVALVLLYCLGSLVRSRLRRAMDWVLLRVPGVSIVYKGVQKVLQTLEQHRPQQRPQRVVLVPFPHAGMKAPAFVTAVCRDLDTQKSLLCVYVPTTPVPTSGYFLLVPEEDVTELNWTPEQALQAIISGGLTAPPDVRYFKTGPAADSGSAAHVARIIPPNQPADGRSALGPPGEVL